MAKHEILNADEEEKEPVIRWSLEVEGDVLRLKAVGCKNEEKMVISIYKSGYFYRHKGANIPGLVLNSMGQIRELNKEE